MFPETEIMKKYNVQVVLGLELELDNKNYFKEYNASPYVFGKVIAIEETRFKVQIDGKKDEYYDFNDWFISPLKEI